VSRNDGKDGQRERDVGHGRDGPAVQGAVAGVEVDQHVDGGGGRNPAEGGEDGQCGAGRVAQVAGDELALELEPDDGEEDRQ
jgi:hypothetical protein